MRIQVALCWRVNNPSTLGSKLKMIKLVLRLQKAEITQSAIVTMIVLSRWRTRWKTKKKLGAGT